MDELLQAIKTLYSGTSGATLRTATPGGYWLDEAPQVSSGVYIVANNISAPRSYAMSTDSQKPATQDCDIQFTLSTLFGTAADVAAAVNAFHSLYDFCSLTMTNYRLLVARRTDDKGPIRDAATRGYVAYITYRFQIGN